MSPEAVAARLPLPFRVGTRTLARVHRRLVRIFIPLEQALAGHPPDLPELPEEAHGFMLRMVPEEWAGRIGAGSGMRAFVRHRYARFYADLDQSFDSYLASFSAKSRSGLKRKRRKLEEHSGGALDVRLYRSPAEAEEFFAQARTLSALTYQERLLDAGLPADALREMRDLARHDRMRAWLLFVEGRPVSYLYAPARGESLLYAHLGYDPAVADLSPGTVLQLEAMRMLTAEGRFRWFDFTEGEGQHKRQFATGAIPSHDLMLLRPTLANIAAARALNGFDAAVEGAKRLLRR